MRAGEGREVKGALVAPVAVAVVVDEEAHARARVLGAAEGEVVIDLLARGQGEAAGLVRLVAQAAVVDEGCS